MNIIIGKRVEFSIKRGCPAGVGTVIDIIDMLNEGGSPVVVTGYLIEEEDTSEIKAVQYWRMLRVLPGELVPTKAVSGGWSAIS